MGAKTQSFGQLEDDLGVGAGLAARCDHRLAQLEQRLCLGTDLEADLESLTLESTGSWKDDIGQFSSWVHKQVTVDIEIERCQGFTPAPAVGMREQQVGAKADQPVDCIRLFLQDAAI